MTPLLSLVLTTGDWTDHLTKLEKVIIKLQEKGLKCNIEKSSFAQYNDKKTTTIANLVDTTLQKLREHLQQKLFPRFLGIFTSETILQISTATHSEANLNQSEPM